MSLKSLLKFDDQIRNQTNNYYLIGIDEVGRGALAGPVIACAYAWKRNTPPDSKNKFFKNIKKLNDSKQLTFKERKYLYSYLISLGDFCVGYASVLEIEKLNILNATYLAMKRAYEGLLLDLKNINTFVLIDGNKFNPYINSLQIAIIDGDTKSSLIACASIIAKVYRDNLMKKISILKNYNNYKWESNAGYGTIHHKKAILENGLTPFHRKLFVRKTLASQANSF